MRDEGGWAVAQVDYKALKSGGFMRQIQKNRFSLRLRIAGGQITAQQLQKVYEITAQYGQGYVHLTSRQGIEIPFIRLEDVETVKNELAEAGLEPGACGPRVRTVTACQGCQICPSGLIDTTALAQELDRRHFARELPHKFKFGITGCGNNCLKAEENDLGIKGGMQPEWIADLCSFCGLCEAVCPTQAIKVRREDKMVSLNEDKCSYCGKCVKSCPAEAWVGKSGFLLYFGGLFGNRIATGQQLLPIIFTEEKLHQVVEATLKFFQEYGKQGERFGRMLDRVGWEHLANDLQEVIR